MDRATETLKRRISQLESDLHAATTKSEELERTNVALRAEAHDVVGQWEKEANDVRRKLNASEARNGDLERSLKASQSQVEGLQKDATAAQQLIHEYSVSINDLQQQLTALNKEKDATGSRAAAAEESTAALAARVEKFEALTAKMQDELTTAVDEKRRDLEEIETLRKSLDEMTEELRFVRREKEELASQAEKLVIRTHELKHQNEALRGDGGALSAQIGALQEEVESLRPRADAAKEFEHALSEARDREQQLSSNVENLQKEVETLLHISQEQMASITTLEGDVQELRDGEENYKRATKELQTILDTHVEDKNSLAHELSVVRENYSSVLIELSEVKSNAEVTIEKLERQLSAVTEHHNQASAEWQLENDKAMAAIQQLHADLQESQLRDLVRMEVIERCELLEAEEREHGHLRYSLLLSIMTQCQTQTALANALTTQMEASERGLEQANALASDLRAKLVSAERAETELRKANGILEEKVHQLDQELQTTQASSRILEQDNEMLKAQVESMRCELGELDEIVNANLTEMRESNETAMAKNTLLAEELRSLTEANAAAKHHTTEVEQQLLILEEEHTAQTAALQLAEDDLRKHKELTRKQETSLTTAQEELRFAQERVDELERENRRIATDASILRDTVSTLETKMKFIVADKRQELDTIRAKLNTYVEKAEAHELRAQSSDERRKEVEIAAANAKESYTRMRATLDELKERCSRDTESIKQLLLERDDSIKERDLIVEKYNRLHDAFHSVRKEISGKAADELQRLVGLCEKQEDELQQLRKQNAILKKSVSMFVTTPPPKAEAVFMEHLNLAEGPLRHPKKRATITSPAE